MKKKVITAAVLGLTLSFFSCSKSSSNSPTPPTPGSSGNTISIANMTFVSSSATVTKGTTVTWTNNDAMIHTVTADDNSFTSGNLNKGDTYSHTFNDAGTVAYHCQVHPSMTASVVIK